VVVVVAGELELVLVEASVVDGASVVVVVAAAISVVELVVGLSARRNKTKNTAAPTRRIPRIIIARSR
jgi:tRNA C32,U32 (ribose-2'-O)-methylase TrmJ